MSIITTPTNSCGVRRKSMSIAEEDAFLLVYDDLMDELSSLPCYEEMTESIEWLRRAIQYAVPGGKQIRGRGVVAAFRAWVDEPKQSEIKETYILGWCIEFFQAYFLIADDIIDGSETRRGKQCWYLVDKIGDLAINDSFLLAGLMNLFLDHFFFEKEYYSLLVELFHDIHLKTSLGQCMDNEVSKNVGLGGFTMAQYKKIVKYKTCYYSFYLPVACAMIVAGKSDKGDFKAVEELVLEIGFLFQVQDDYLDCYGDPKITGKIGTDISENKCSWLVVKALEKANERQREELRENYGKGVESTTQNEQFVKRLYAKLGIPEEFTKFEEQCYKKICAQIEKLSDKIPTAIFLETADVIYHRSR